MQDVTAADSLTDRYAYALETDRMANDLYDYIFPPWRWAKWLRTYREVNRRIQVSRRARGAA